jgi:predicted SnoaL-like aldol condensation-catalyzing enzyme
MSQAQLEANKKLVMDFCRIVVWGHDLSKAREFIGDVYIQHNPNLGDGYEALMDYANERWKGRPPIERTPTAVMAEGDLVVVITTREYPDPGDPSKTYTTGWFDLFRVKDGKLVEHWDGAPKIVD